MTITIKETIFMPAWCYTALKNNDFSGLNADDEKRAKELDERLSKDYGVATLDIINGATTSLGFSCFGVADSCYDVQVWAGSEVEKQKNTWQTFTVRTSNLTEKQVKKVEKKIAEALEELRALNGYTLKAEVQTDSGTF